MRNFEKYRFIKLDDIDIDTIDRIEFRKDKNEEPCAIVYHVYKHRGTYITEISIEKAEEYLEENDELLHSYSFEGNSVSRDTFYALLKQEEKDSDVSEEDEEKPKEVGTVSKTEAEKKAFAAEVLKNIHKQQYEEEMRKYNKESEEKEEQRENEEKIINSSVEEDKKIIDSNIIKDIQVEIDEEKKNLRGEDKLPIKNASKPVSPVSGEQDKIIANPTTQNIFADNDELSKLINETWGKTKPAKSKTEDTSEPIKKEETKPKTSKNANDLTLRALWNTVGTSPEESSMEDEEVQLFHKIIGSDEEKTVGTSTTKESKPVVDKTKGNNITGIIIYSAINRDNKFVNRAMVTYENGVIHNVSEEVFTEMIAKEAHKRGYSDHNKLVEEGFVVFTTVNNLVRDWDKYFGDNSKVYPTSSETKTAKEKPAEPKPAESKPMESIKIDPIQVQKKAKPKNENQTGAKKSTNTNSTSTSKPIVPTPINTTSNTSNNTKGSNSSTGNTASNSTNNSTTKKPVTTSSSKKTKKQGIFSRIGNFFKRHIVATVAVITAGIIALSCALGGKSSKREKDELNPTQSYSQTDNNNNSNNNNNKNNNNNNNTAQNKNDKISALNSLRDTNNLRYEFLERVGGATEKYNTEFANQYYEAAKGSKLAHSFDETVSEYLVYNDFSKEELSVIFGNDKLDANTLSKNFNSAIKVDGQLHNLQTHTVNRENLFKTQEGRDFYKKYSELFTSLNKSTVNETKVEKLEEFYDMLREDFDFSTIPSQEDSYKLSILEYISAVDNINVNVDIENALTSSEKAYFEKLNDVAKTKLQDVATVQNSKSINTSDSNLQVSDYRELVEEYLRSQNAYNLTNRDVSNYDSYKAHTNINVAVKEEKTEKTTTNNNTSNNGYSSDTYASDDYSGYSDDTDDEVELIIGDEDDTDEVELIIGDEDTTTSESITIETEDGQTGELVIDTENGTAEIYLDDFVEDEYASTTTTDSETVYSDGVLNEDGSLSDNYKESSNGDGAVSQDTELPDPNSISDEQLEAMMLALNGSDQYEAPKVLKL